MVGHGCNHILRNDHKTVERLFKRFEKAGDRALVERREIVDRIVEELSVHAAIEEQVSYPVARATVPGRRTSRSRASRSTTSSSGCCPSSTDRSARRRFDAKVTVLIENVRHHVEEEESGSSRRCATSSSRDALGRSRPTPWPRRRRRRRPTRTRASPDDPPANMVAGAIAGVIGRVTDNVSGVAQGGVSAIQDLIATVTRNKKPVTSPTGSSAARAGEVGAQDRRFGHRRCRPDGARLPGPAWPL